jgi:hypothetical protein
MTSCRLGCDPNAAAYPAEQTKELTRTISARLRPVNQKMDKLTRPKPLGRFENPGYPGISGGLRF